MIRETSLKAYREITLDGTKEILKHKVWKYIIDHGPCTQAQAHKELCRSYGDGSGSYTGRFSELKREGAIIEVGEIICPITHKTHYLWDVTGRAPIKLEKEEKIKCHICHGKGYFIEQQTRFSLR